MSVELSPDYPLQRRLSRPASEIARSIRVDPRIPATVPGFDVPFFQAGLAGYSDAAMRLIARRHGCPYCVTEALLDQTLINGGKGRRREDPDLLAEECGTGDLEENRAAPGTAPIGEGLNDHPIAGQIMGTVPDQMAQGAAILAGMNYDVIDVNLACPVRKIRKRNRGGHCLTDADHAITVLRAVRQAVPAHIPTTVKLRRAFDDTPEMARRFERIFNAAYELGYCWATVHCRTVVQKYRGPARWQFLVDLVKRYPDRLIFGSGDVWTAEDIFAMLDITGVHAVSVARGCIGNPWIFRQARQMMEFARECERPLPPALGEQRAALLEHFELCMALHGERAASRMMRKFGIKFSQHHPQPQRVKEEFIRCRSVADWRAVLDAHYGSARERDGAGAGAAEVMAG